MAGGPARRRPARSRRDALRAGRHQGLREHSGAMGRRQLRHAADARRRFCRRRGGGSPGARGQARRGAAARAIACSTSSWALSTIAGVLVVLGAAWLVWTRPGAMTWGFFVYVIQFNPGQAFQFWAWLQLWPWALLAQDVIFLRHAGRRLHRAPPVCAAGRRSTGPKADGGQSSARCRLWRSCSWRSRSQSIGTRLRLSCRNLAREASILIGFAVSAAALAILIGRRRDLSPRDYQRIRWVIWGCLIGLPAYLLAELSQETSLLGEPVRRGRGVGGRGGRSLPRQRDPVPVRRRGGAAPDRGQRVDPAAPRDRARASAQRAGPLPARADRDDRRIHPPARLGLARWSPRRSST